MVPITVQPLIVGSKKTLKIYRKSQPDLSVLAIDGDTPARIPTASAESGYFSMYGVKIAPAIDEP